MADKLGRLPRAVEVGGDHARGLQRPHEGAKPARLLDSAFGQAGIVLSLQPCLGVPGGFAVAHKNKPHQSILFPFIANTASGAPRKATSIGRSEEHTTEVQSPMGNSYDVF